MKDGIIREFSLMDRAQISNIRSDLLTFAANSPQ
jgi:hypothetical protein